MADKAHVLIDEKLEEMERRLSAIYSRASKEIGKAWKEYLKESAEEIKDLQEKYDTAKKSGNQTEIRKTGKALQQAKKERTLQDKRFKALSEKTAIEISKVNETALAYINGELPEVYVLGYNALESAVDGIGGYAFSLIDANTVKNLSLEDGSLLPYKKLDPAKDIPWNMKKINAEVLQGILQGESMDKIANRIGRVQQMNQNASIRTARTIVTGAENKGRQDSYEKAVADGVILDREWLAADDGRVREWHNELDGQQRAVDKPFSNSVGLIMYPGDPGAHPANVYNCRCTLKAVVKGFKKVAL